MKLRMNDIFEHDPDFDRHPTGFEKHEVKPKKLKRMKRNERDKQNRGREVPLPGNNSKRNEDL